MTCGIYCITNMINGMKYVGQSVCIEKRFIQHIESDSNSKIHEAIVEYGQQNFNFEILIECSENELNKQEAKFIRLLGTYEDGYNQNKGNHGNNEIIRYIDKDTSKLEKQLNKLKVNMREKNKEINMLKKQLRDEKNIYEKRILSLEIRNKQLLDENYSLSKQLLEKVEVNIESIDFNPNNIFEVELMKKEVLL